jgi:hypothetical protein
MKNKKNISDLIKDILIDCTAYDVSIEFCNDETISFNKRTQVAGYWDEESKTIKVAIGRKDWITLLVHEYCHFCQWKELKFSSDEEVKAFEEFDNWLLKKKDLEDSLLTKHMNVIQECELDCEIRTVSKFKEYNVLSKKQIEDYIQKSNAYVFGYEAVKRKRSWFKKALYTNEKITKMCSKKFTKSLMPEKKILNKIMKECF